LPSLTITFNSRHTRVAVRVHENAHECLRSPIAVRRKDLPSRPSNCSDCSDLFFFQYADSQYHSVRSQSSRSENNVIIPRSNYHSTRTRGVRSQWRILCVSYILVYSRTSCQLGPATARRETNKLLIHRHHLSDCDERSAIQKTRSTFCGSSIECDQLHENPSLAPQSAYNCSSPVGNHCGRPIVQRVLSDLCALSSIGARNTRIAKKGGRQEQWRSGHVSRLFSSLS
jgi:hypothetical protein